MVNGISPHPSLALFVSVIVTLSCLEAATFGALLYPPSEAVKILEGPRVIDPFGDSDQIINKAPNVLLQANRKYEIEVAVRKKTYVLLSKPPTSTIKSWSHFGELHTCENTATFVIDSADLGAAPSLLLTAWGDPQQWEKGSGVPLPVPLTRSPTNDEVKNGLPFAFEFSLNGETVKLKISRAR